LDFRGRIGSRKRAARDHTGLYARMAASGDLEYSSIPAPYEPPEAPDIALDSATTPVETCAGVVIERLMSRPA